MNLDLKILFWPFVLMCCRHCVLLPWIGYCPSVGTDLYVWAFCILWWWECFGDLVRLQWLEMEVILLILVLLQWIGCGIGCWYDEVLDCVLPYGWQKCHQYTLDIDQECEAVLRNLISNSSINILAMRGLMGNPWQHLVPVCNTYLGRGSMCFKAELQ